MQKSKVVQEKKELLNILVDRKQLEQIGVDRHEKFSRSEIVKQGQYYRALAFINSARALLKVVGKEKAKEAMAKAVYDYAYLEGREAAEERGNPKDLASYLEYEDEIRAEQPFLPPPEVLEKTKNKIVYGTRVCPFANSVREFRKNAPQFLNDDTLEIVASRCDMLYSGRANGFNRDMKFKRINFKLDDLLGGPQSKGCYFEAEVPE